MSSYLKTTTLNFAAKGSVATIQLKRPETLNAIDENMIKELVSLLKEISISGEFNIVVLTGGDQAFSSGGDIKNMLMKVKNEEQFASIMELVSELAITLYNLPMLTISTISGPAVGLGLSLALATDYIIAHENSKIAMNFINIGLIPDGGAHFFLQKKLGEDRAKEFIWSGKTLTAQEALEMKLVDVVTYDCKKATEQKIEEWLSKPIEAMIRSKKILAETNRPKLLKILELEKNGQQRMRETEDHQEGMNAFLEKRIPVFKGK